MRTYLKSDLISLTAQTVPCNWRQQEHDGHSQHYLARILSCHLDFPQLPEQRCKEHKCGCAVLC